jgi:hypothetical protein
MVPAGHMKTVKIVVGIDDRVYMRWQLSILLESLHGKLPPGWEVWVVVCNGHEPLSADLQRVLDAYGARHFTGIDHPRDQNMDFAAGRDVYVPLNRIEALRVVGEHLGADDLVCLTETDVFLHGDLNPSVFPQGNALFDNWIVREKLFFGYGSEKVGVQLPLLLEAMGCKTPFKAGGVTVFLDAPTLRNEKVVQDAFRFAQVLYLLGSMLEVKNWTAEMPAVALSLTLNGIDYEVIDTPEFTTQNTDHESIPPGSFYHYYVDYRQYGRGAFRGSRWYKHKYLFENFLLHDLAPYRRDATTEHEKEFFQYAERTRRRAWRIAPPESLEKRTTELRAGVRHFGLGFRKAELDPTLFDLLRRRLQANLDRLEHEPDDVSRYIGNVEPGSQATRFHRDEEFNRALLLALKPLHEEWCGFPLVPSACYGIRVYQRGAYLHEHVDTSATHIVSSTICVGKETEGPWPLSIEDAEGELHEVAIEPGEMLFYEGAYLRHGRPYPLQGSYYAGIYLHYRPADEAPPSAPA